MLWTAVLYALLGLAVGSFLNVCIHRLPRRESVVVPASHCPACGHGIAPYDNIPVVSYLVLAGRCRHCGARISLRYPAVEILTALAFYACAAKWEFSGPCFVNSLLLAAVIVLMFIDYDHQILPNVVTLPGTVAGIALCAFQDPAFYMDRVTYRLSALLSPGGGQSFLAWVGSLFGAAVGAGTLFAVAALYELVRKRQGLGMGDVKMMAMVGAFLGWRLAVLTIFMGSALGSLLGVFLMLFHGRSLQTKLAFGTFLGAATALALFFGLPFLDWYAGSLPAAP
jgi:leader peptidase (prepilin peptidase) / N-methyltransferase